MELKIGDRIHLAQGRDQCTFLFNIMTHKYSSLWDDTACRLLNRRLYKSRYSLISQRIWIFRNTSVRTSYLAVTLRGGEILSCWRTNLLSRRNMQRGVRYKNGARNSLAYYAAVNGSSVSTFRNYISVQSSRVKEPKKKALFFAFFTREDGTDWFYRNVGTELPSNAA
jgi:hypothetical protein